MKNTSLINSLIESYFENHKDIDCVEANVISKYLAKKGVLSHSTKGQPFRELLRKGLIPYGEQPGGKNTPWYIRRPGNKCINAKFSGLGKDIAYTNNVHNDNIKGLEPIFDHDVEILILGTLPGAESLKLQQYYSNRGKSVLENNFRNI